MRNENVHKNRDQRYHDSVFDDSNWCAKCHLYYCWHPECKTYRNDDRANHKFIPGTKAIFGEPSYEEDE